MNRVDLKRISMIRQREARVLRDAGCFPGSYYLTGYAVECALKARIAKRVQRHDFPDKELGIEAYTHNLKVLMRVAGLDREFEHDMKANSALRFNWLVVASWSESSRYEHQVTKQEAFDMYAACTARKDGILSWLRKRW